VVSLDQLRDEGVSRRRAAERAEDGKLHRIHRGVYTVGHRSVSRATRLRAALLACGEGAVISHGTAAAFHRLFDESPHFIDVTVPVEGGRKIDGIRCRRCRYPEPEEVEVRSGIAVTTVARTLVDLAGILRLPDLRKVVGRVAIRRKLDLQAVDIALYNAKGRGQRFLVDFLWEKEYMIVETDGRETHETPTAFQDDRRRDQFLVAAGYRVLRVTWNQIHGDTAGVLGRISRALRAGS
jgi:hypothetical protein